MAPNPIPLSPTQIDLLVALAGGPQSANQALDTLATWTQVPPLGTFYRHLARAVDHGWVAVAEPTTAAGPGRPERRYRLTACGERVVRAALDRSLRLLHLARMRGLVRDAEVGS